MTARQLWLLSLQRSATLRHSKSWTLSNLTAWLQQQVDAGLLTKRYGRYYLTPEGLELALTIGGHLPRAHTHAHIHAHEHAYAHVH